MIDIGNSEGYQVRRGMRPSLKWSRRGERNVGGNCLETQRYFIYSHKHRSDATTLVAELANADSLAMAKALGRSVMLAVTIYT
jgi:hypothetical protein